MKKILCTISILAMLSGCKQSTEQITETTVSETTAEITTAKVTTETTTETSSETASMTKDNIIFDEDNGTLYYFFKDGETVDLSSIEGINNVTKIKIEPLEKDYKFENIIYSNSDTNFDGIEDLYVSRGFFNDVSFLKAFGNLQYIYFNSCKLKDTSAIGEITSIITISAEDCTIDNLDFLSKIKVRNIYFENTPVEKIPYLTLAEREDTVDYHSICFNNCGEIDISGLAGLENLLYGSIYEIDLSGSIVKDFSPLAELPIHRLNLSNTYGSDYETLNGISADEIWLDNCNLSDISFLSYNKVGTLSLSNNNIYDWSPLLDVERLLWCWTFDNPVIMPENIEDFENKEIKIADSNKYAYPY